MLSAVRLAALNASSSHASGSDAMPDAPADLRALVERSVMVLFALSDTKVTQRPAPDKWSPKEVMGHLIDSAANNHRRFVQAQGREDLVFEGYEQDAWVEMQRYEDADWASLVTLWWMYNKHLARVMAAVPADIRLRPAQRHNLHEIAWRPMPASEPATLDDLMQDYVGHLRHHLAQIVPGLAEPAPSSQKDR